MNDFTTIEKVGAFHVPEFDLQLDGADGGARLRYDVLELSYTDDSEALDSFEFSLLDWDPVLFEPVYSSPWDSKGKIKKYTTQDGQAPIPVLSPGTAVSLYLSYQDHGGPAQLMLRGKVVSLTTSFPATGVPICRVRVLNPLADYEKKTLTGNATGGKLDIIAEIATQLDVEVDFSDLSAEITSAEHKQEEPITNLTERNPVQYIRELAGDLGFVARLSQGETKDVLMLVSDGSEPYKLTWGRTLASFTPTISSKSLVKRAVVRAPNLKGESLEDQKIEAVANWDDLKFKKDAIPPGVLEQLTSALDGHDFVNDKPKGKDKIDPASAAINKLRELAKDLIRCTGQTVGLPNLRAGSRVEILGVGALFSGIYEVTKTTHTIGSAGYTTGFEARKEVLDD